METFWDRHIKRVHYQETDQMGVVHHANYVNWFEIARTEWMRAKGIAYKEIEKLGLMLPVLEVNVKYHQSAFYDEQVAIYTKIQRMSPVRLVFYYEVRQIDSGNTPHNTNEEEFAPQGDILTTGTTSHMWVNAQWKPARVDKTAPEVWALLQDNYAEKEGNS